MLRDLIPLQLELLTDRDHTKETQTLDPLLLTDRDHTKEIQTLDPLVVLLKQVTLPVVLKSFLIQGLKHSLFNLNNRLKVQSCIRPAVCSLVVVEEVLVVVVVVLYQAKVLALLVRQDVTMYQALALVVLDRQDVTMVPRLLNPKQSVLNGVVLLVPLQRQAVVVIKLVLLNHLI